MGNKLPHDATVQAEAELQEEHRRCSVLPGSDVCEGSEPEAGAAAPASEMEEHASPPSAAPMSSPAYKVEWYMDQRVRHAPDYDDDETWAALPDSEVLRHKPQQTITVRGASLFEYSEEKVKIDPAHWADDIAADCFYVHPTTYGPLSRGHNQSIAASQQDKEVYACVRTQATVFDGVCRVFSPHYRQACLRMYIEEGRQNAFDLAYSDVREAFFAYIRRFNNGRPFFLAGHSQGSQHLIRLLREEFDVDTEQAAALRSQLICAYALGFGVGVDSFPHGNVRVAEGAEDIGSVFVSFCTISLAKQNVGLHQLGEYMLTSQPIAHNPLSWRYNDDQEVIINEHLGSIDAKGDSIYKTLHGGFVSAKATKAGELRIEDQKYRAYTQALEDAGGEYHSMEINLFWVNLRENVKLRAHAFHQ